ncbi:tRNA (adenosine(37)-N6)-threonylcarbamoyltransferase complex ATPase subunit type 1 TsaE [Thermodesulfobacteriota bacterium]
MFMRLELSTHSEEETVLLGSAIGKTLRDGDLVLLLGQLGSGKTRLAKGLVSAATGVPEDDVVSPTFTLMNSFEGPIAVHHADLYRIAPNQVEGIGLEEALDGGVLVAEWAEDIRDFTDDPLEIIVEQGDSENLRHIVLGFREDGSWGSRLEKIALRHGPERSEA